MKYLKRSILLVNMLLFASSCSVLNKSNFLEFEDQGNILITITTIIDDEEIAIDSGTKLNSSQFNQLELTIEQLSQDLSIQIYWDGVDVGFPISEVKNKDSSLKSGFYRKVVENYDSISYPDFFEVGTHTIKIFEFDQEGNRDQTPTSYNVESLKTINYEVVE